MQVAYVWFSKWSLVKVLYLGARYILPIPASMAIIYSTASSASPSLCRIWFAIGSATTIIGIALAEGLLYLRVFALAGRGRVVGSLLAFLFFGLHGGIFVSLVRFLNSLEYAPSPIPTVVPCYTTKAKSKLLSTVYIMVLCSEIVIMFMTLWICFTRYKASKSPLVALFYRDGLGYFWILSLISAGNIICHFAAPITYIYLFAIPQGMLHGILSTRLILHLREAGPAGDSETSASEGIHLSTFMAATRADNQKKNPDNLAIPLEGVSHRGSITLEKTLLMPYSSLPA